MTTVEMWIWLRVGAALVKECTEFSTKCNQTTWFAIVHLHPQLGLGFQYPIPVAEGNLHAFNARCKKCRRVYILGNKEINNWNISATRV